MDERQWVYVEGNLAMVGEGLVEASSSYGGRAACSRRAAAQAQVPGHRFGWRRRRRLPLSALPTARPTHDIHAINLCSPGPRCGRPRSRGLYGRDEVAVSMAVEALPSWMC